MDDLDRTLAARAPDLAPAEVDRLVELVRRVCATPVGVTAVREPQLALERHVLDALRGLAAVDAAPPGPLVDVGSGGGIPGLVLAVVRPDRACHLVEANGRKAGFLEELAAALGVDAVVHGRRSEEVGMAGGPLRDAAAVVVARALANPPVAAELCLPLCRPGGRVVLWVGESAVPTEVGAVAALVAGRLVAQGVPGLVVLEKTGPTPPGFPRRPGMAAKRPLGG